MQECSREIPSCTMVGKLRNRTGIDLGHLSGTSNMTSCEIWGLSGKIINQIITILNCHVWFGTCSQFYIIRTDRCLRIHLEIRSEPLRVLVEGSRNHWATTKRLAETAGFSVFGPCPYIMVYRVNPWPCRKMTFCFLFPAVGSCGKDMLKDWSWPAKTI